jgi:TolB-like protein/tetratricopeptide (TPR) repeat protein
MEAAEEATYARLKELLATLVEPAIKRHGGRLVKSTGDGFLAMFDGAIEATDCAVKLQQRLARMPAKRDRPAILFRMGINLTEAIIEPQDIFGDGVNLAVRLQASAEPGGIVVAAAVADGLRTRPGFRLADLGELTLKHLRRPVHAFAVKLPSGAAPRATLHIAPPDDRPSIAVLPFRLLPEEEAKDSWFAEGIIEGIIHILSGIENLFVISRGTSLAYAGQAVDPRRVGRDLGVRYVLSGIARRTGDRLRIFTELADAATGSVLRADRREGKAADLFEMQDRIAGEVVAQIAPAVHDSELQRAMRMHPDSVTAYDLLLQGLHVLYMLRRESFDRARGLLQQAMAHDPGYGPAYSHAATWHMFRIGQGWSANVGEDAAEAQRCAAAALERDANDAVALAIHGQMLSFTQHDYANARLFLDRAIAAGPSCHMAWTLSSTTAGWTGDGRRAVEHAERAMQLSPLDPFAFFAEHMLSQGHYVAGEYEEAVAWGRRAASLNPMLASNLRTLAASLMGLGDPDGARDIARRILEGDPGFSVAAYAARSALTPQVLAPFAAHLRAAGLPG